MQTFSLIIYNVSIRLYGFAISIASLYNDKAKLWRKGRKHIYHDLEKIKAKKGKRIWFHCASLGEFEQARPLIEKIKASHPHAVIILTFFSPSGYEIRKNYAGADVVLYMALDTKANAEQFIETLRPDLALFVKYQFWYHHLNTLRSKGIPVVLFSSVFRKEQIFFKWYGGFFRNMLGLFSKIFVQNEDSAGLLKSISINAEVAPDTRFDRVYQISIEKKTYPVVEQFKGNSKLLIAGSTWSKDEELLGQLINQQILTGYKFIIAPHNLIETELSKLEDSIRIKTCRFSKLTAANATETQVVIVDTMGDLSSLYAYGNVAYVGGGFDTSVHNVLECAVYGMPILFGPHYQKSEEAKELIKNDAAFAISGYDQLLQVLKKLDADSKMMSLASKNAVQYVQVRLGSTNKIYQYLTTLVIGGGSF